MAFQKYTTYTFHTGRQENHTERLFPAALPGDSGDTRANNQSVVSLQTENSKNNRTQEIIVFVSWRSGVEKTAHICTIMSKTANNNVWD